MDPTLTVRYVDKCAPDFVTDHCNGERELLLTILPAGQSPVEAARELFVELNSADFGKDLPDLPDNTYLRAFEAATRAADLRAVDEDGNPVNPGSDEDVAEDQPNLWFRLSWTEVSDGE